MHTQADVYTKLSMKAGMGVGGMCLFWYDKNGYKKTMEEKK